MKAYAVAIDKPGSYAIKWAVWSPWFDNGRGGLLKVRYATESQAARRAYAINIQHMAPEEIKIVFS